MGLFDDVKPGDDVQASGDVVRGTGRKTIPSNIENCMIKHAYGHEAKSGALGVTVTLTVADGDHKDRDIRITEYVTSGTEKGKKSTYTDRDGNEQMLPGFATINELTRVVAGKKLSECATEKKTIELYNFDQKKDVPTEVDMLTDLVGKPVKACILSTIEDKQKKNDSTGKYENTGETVNKNTVDKFLDPQTKKTASETENGVDADYAPKWEERWKDQVNDQSKGAAATSGLKGAPSAPSGEAAPAKLFG